MTLDSAAREAASLVKGDPGFLAPTLRRRQAFITAIAADYLTATIRFPESTQDLVGIPFMHQMAYPTTGDTVWVDQNGPDTVISSAFTGLPVGVVMMDAGSTPPVGWLLCNGQSTSGYPALAARVGATVPDLRDKFVVGAGSTYAGGATGGQAGGHSHGIGTLDSAAEGSHTHTGPSHTHTGPSHTHNADGGQSFITDGGSVADIVRGGGQFQVKSITAPGGTGDTGAGGTGSGGTGGSHDHVLSGRSGNTGGFDGDAASSNLPPYYAIRYIIKHD